MGSLEGKVVLVTGGGSGIGRATALMLAAEGARVALAGRRKEPLAQVVAEIEREKGTAVVKTCDLTKAREARELGAWVVKTFGGLDILINNAGQSSHARSIRWIGQDEWDAVLGVNTTGVYALTQSVLPSMLERGAGTVVTVASMAALRPGGFSGVAYGVAKAGARAMMQALHTELRNRRRRRLCGPVVTAALQPTRHAARARIAHQGPAPATAHVRRDRDRRGRESSDRRARGQPLWLVAAACDRAAAHVATLRASASGRAAASGYQEAGADCPPGASHERRPPRHGQGRRLGVRAHGRR